MEATKSRNFQKPIRTGQRARRSHQLLRRLEVELKDEIDRYDAECQLVWFWVFVFIVGHCVGVTFMRHTYATVKWQTYAFIFAINLQVVIVTLVGNHRMWSHRSFRAVWPVRLYMAIVYSLYHTDTILKWAAYHRVHHKWGDTLADPYAVTRGFLFGHIGWTATREHPLTTAALRHIDLSDLHAEKIVMWQHRYYWIIVAVFGYILPVTTAYYWWSESLINSIGWVAFCRIIPVVHYGAAINSLGHTVTGSRRWEVTNSATDSWLMIGWMGGEGWHNFHHAFPLDYANAPQSARWWCNPCTWIIDAAAWLGLVYDRKFVSEDVLAKRLALNQSIN